MVEVPKVLVLVAPPGEAVIVQEEGKPLRATLPVGLVQLGCVMAPITGAEGVGG